MDEHEPQKRPRWNIELDLRDVIGGGGALMIMVGAAVVHWALVLVIGGAALCALAYRLSR